MSKKTDKELIEIADSLCDFVSRRSRIEKLVLAFSVGYVVSQALNKK